MRSSLLPTSLLPFLLSQVSATCYDIYGTSLASSRPDIAPCNNIAGTVSMCCKTNVTSPIEPDVCMQNGLCRQAGTSPPVYWRNDCSSESWPSGGCLKVCTGNATILDGSGNVKMTPCDGTPTSSTWCCGTDTTCCGSSSAIILAAVLGSSSTSSLPSSTASSTSPTSSPTTSTTPTSTPTPTSQPNNTSSSSGLSTGAKAGIGVGAAVLVFGISALVACGPRPKWRRKLMVGELDGGRQALPAYSDNHLDNGGAKSWTLWGGRTEGGYMKPGGEYGGNAMGELPASEARTQELDGHGTARRGELA